MYISCRGYRYYYGSLTPQQLLSSDEDIHARVVLVSDISRVAEDSRHWRHAAPVTRLRILSSSHGNAASRLVVSVNQGGRLQSGEERARSTFRIRTTRLAVVVTSLHRELSPQLFISCFQPYQF